MSFDLYFAGSQFRTGDKYLIENSLPRLMSQLNDRTGVEHYKLNEFSGKFFIDSGAYTAHNSDTILDVDKYIEYINSNDMFTLAAQVDTIPGRFGHVKTRQEIEEASAKTWENFLYMVVRLKNPKILIPVYHQGEDIKYLKRMLEFRYEDNTPLWYLGLSPANDSHTNEKRIFIDKCFDIIKSSSNPDVKTHAFGMTSLKVLEDFPLTSADSTSWKITGANGGIMTKFGVIAVSSKKSTDPKHYTNMPKEAQKELSNYVQSFGFNLAELGEDYKCRMVFNIKYLQDWSLNYKLNRKTHRKKKLF